MSTAINLDDHRVRAIADEILAIEQRLAAIRDLPRTPDQAAPLLGTAIGLRTRQAELGCELALTVKDLLG